MRLPDTYARLTTGDVIPKPDLRAVTLLSLLLSFFGWGYNAFTQNVRVDVEVFINDPGTLQGWLTIGRWGMYPIKLLLGTLHFNPYYSGALFLVLWGLSAVAWLALFEEAADRRLRGRWIFVVTYVLSHWWSYSFYFTIQAAEIAFCMLLIPTATFLLLRAVSHRENRKSISALVAIPVSSAMYLISFATYQALVVVTITCMSAALFFYSGESLTEERFEKVNSLLKRGFLFLGVFLFCYLLYSLITNWYFSSSSYLSSQIMWGTAGVSECLKAVARYIRDVLFANCLGETGLFSLSFLVSIPFVAKNAVIAKRGNESSNNSRPVVACLLYVFIFIVFLASPFFLAFYKGSGLLPRTQLSIAVESAALLLFAYDSLRALANKKRITIASLALSLAVMVFVVQGANLNWRNFYTDDIRYQQELSFAQRISNDLSNEYGELLNECPVVFVGKWSAPLNPACVREDLWGCTLFEQDYMAFGNPAYNTYRINGFLRSALGVWYLDATAEQQAIAVEAAEQMDAYPNSSSIQLVDGVIVVKLDE